MTDEEVREAIGTWVQARADGIHMGFEQATQELTALVLELFRRKAAEVVPVGVDAKPRTMRPFEYALRLLLELHVLMESGKEDSPEADEIRDKMDGPFGWGSSPVGRLSDEEASLLSEISSAFYGNLAAGLRAVFQRAEERDDRLRALFAGAELEAESKPTIETIIRARDLLAWADAVGLTTTDISVDALGGVAVYLGGSAPNRQAWFSILNDFDAARDTIVLSLGDAVVKSGVLTVEGRDAALTFLNEGT